MTPLEPFFAPLPDPRSPAESAEPYYPDLPFQVPMNVVGVPVALRLGLARTMDTLAVLSHAVVYDRGLTLTVQTWVRPGTELDDMSRPWEVLRPRFGVLLHDGTKVGHDPTRDWGAGPDLPQAHRAEEAGPEVAPGIAQVDGSAGPLTTSTTWWLYPFPSGPSLELVLAWEARGMDETFTPLPLAELRAASAVAEPLWPIPGPPEGTHVGWASFGNPLGSQRPDSYLASTDPADPGYPG